MPVCPIDTGRYGLPEMVKLFDERTKYKLWLKVEAALAYAHAKVGNIPEEAAKEIMRKASLKYVKISRIKKIESKINHDLMAMVKALTEVCEGDAGKYVHLGATSYDIEDSALAIQLKKACNILLKRLTTLKNALLDKADKYKDLVAVGRTHGIHASPITYGLKFAVWACEVDRHIKRLRACRDRIAVGKLRGATGTQASLGGNAIELEKIFLKKLGLKRPLVTTQIIQRDRHCELIMVMALIAATMEKIATEIRNLQRTEIAEVEEPFGKRQVGSSAMPAKRNPIICERICGLARVIRSMVIPALENIVLWHERDLTNSSSERFIIPNSLILTDYIVHLMTYVMENLRIKEDKIAENLKLTDGLNMSEALVIKLVEKGLGRQEAHELIREIAMEAQLKNLSFKDLLLKDPRIQKLLTKDEIEEALNPRNFIGTAVIQIEECIRKLRR